jgi:hypothetical protein
MTAIVVASVAVWRLLPDDDDARATLRRWLAVAGCGLFVAIGGWVLYIPADPYYSPVSAGVGNRTNVMAAVGVIVLVYAVIALATTLLLRGLPGWRPAAAVLTVTMAAILGLGYASDVRNDQRTWIDAGESSDQVLTALSEAVPDPAPGDTLYTFGHPAQEAFGVAIFGYSWDLLGAARLLYDDPSVIAYPVIAGTTMQCGRERMGPLGPGWSPELQGATYGTGVFVDVSTATANRIGSLRACRAALPRYVPGPIVKAP